MNQKIENQLSVFFWPHLTLVIRDSTRGSVKLHESTRGEGWELANVLSRYVSIYLFYTYREQVSRRRGGRGGKGPREISKHTREVNQITEPTTRTKISSSMEWKKIRGEESLSEGLMMGS
jgi:hypothetical protein